jgi:DNA (cytosine-5)-methyltransferase 1
MASPKAKGAVIPDRRVVAEPGRVVDICAGPGGMDMGSKILGLPPMVGVELDADAVATGKAAGFERVHCDMHALAPARHRGVHGVVITPPCPGFSKAGLGLGRKDMQTILDAVTCFGAGCGCEWPDLAMRTLDARSKLVVEAARWVLTAPNLRWFLCEQVPEVMPVWEDISAEAYAAGWEYVNVVQLSAADYGLPSKRVRTFVYGRRYDSPRVSVWDAGVNGADLPRHTMASVLDLPAGTRVWTRGDRKTSGGNAFSVDGPSWCLTGSTRSWKVGAPDGRELTASEAGLLNGFPADYPWQGSRTKQFLQIADVVNPVIAAVALGVATNTPWVEPVRRYLERLYPNPVAPCAPEPPAAEVSPFDQLDLFAALGVAA